MTDHDIVNIDEQGDASAPLSDDILIDIPEPSSMDRLEREMILKNTREALSNPRNLAAAGAGALMLGGLELARRSNVRDKEKKKPGFLKRTLGTIAGLGLTGAGAYGAYKLMKPVSENANPYQSAFKPSAILPTAAGTAAAISAFPLADVITSGMKEGPLKTVSNIGAKALLSTLGTAGAGYVGYEAGKAIEREQEKRRRQEMQDRNKFLPDFYYDNVG